MPGELFTISKQHLKIAARSACLLFIYFKLKWTKLKHFYQYFFYSTYFSNVQFIFTNMHIVSKILTEYVSLLSYILNFQNFTQIRNHKLFIDEKENMNQFKIFIKFIKYSCKPINMYKKIPLVKILLNCRSYSIKMRECCQY